MKICVTGGGGYVGSLLVPMLLNTGHDVTVLDTFWFGTNVFGDLQNKKSLNLVKGDIRNPVDLRRAFYKQDAVIHLACISNDPSFEMNPELGKSINLDAFTGILSAVKDLGVRRFIYASSSSVYGIKSEENVTEDLKCEPLTDYSKFKLQCEEELASTNMEDVEWCVIRPATVCGHAPRMRLDLIVNVLSINAIYTKKMVVHGGSQLRPNINIRDMIQAYQGVLNADKEKIHRQVFNVGNENMNLLDIAKCVRTQCGDPSIEIACLRSDDKRSYHVNSEKIAKAIGFIPKHSIEKAISSIIIARSLLKYKDPMNNSAYYNIKRMKEVMSEGQV